MSQFHRDQASDSNEVVIPLMLDGLVFESRSGIAFITLASRLKLIPSSSLRLLAKYREEEGQFPRGVRKVPVTLKDLR